MAAITQMYGRGTKRVTHMARQIVILGTLDTKGEHLHLLKQKIEARGHRALILDLSMGAFPSYPQTYRLQRSPESPDTAWSSSWRLGTGPSPLIS